MRFCVLKVCVLRVGGSSVYTVSQGREEDGHLPELRERRDGDIRHRERSDLVLRHDSCV